MSLGHKTGVLLANLGTPDDAQTGPVRRYLREFLMDHRVIDINPVGRWMLVNLIIAPFRAPKSAHAYQKVWTERGSPLLFHSQDLHQKVAARLPQFQIELGMRYGNPSMVDAMQRLRAADCDHLVIVPLYPQFASSTTGSTLELAYGQARRLWNTPFISVTPPFFAHPGFLDAFAAVGRPTLDDLDPQHVVFSFHGLPERQIHKSDPSGAHCLRAGDCCERAVAGEGGRDCYRAQCFATARGIAERLGLAEDQYTVSFQSRLGRTKWIEPYTNEVVTSLRDRGIERVAVYCPAFVADCLETLEEIGMGVKADFEAGNAQRRLELVPSLNSHDAWVAALCELIERTAVPAHRLPVLASGSATVEKRGRAESA